MKAHLGKTATWTLTVSPADGLTIPKLSIPSVENASRPVSGSTVRGQASMDRRGAVLVEAVGHGLVDRRDLRTTGQPELGATNSPRSGESGAVRSDRGAARAARSEASGGARTAPRSESPPGAHRRRPRRTAGSAPSRGDPEAGPQGPTVVWSDPPCLRCVQALSSGFCWGGGWL